MTEKVHKQPISRTIRFCEPIFVSLGGSKNRDSMHYYSSSQFVENLIVRFSLQGGRVLFISKLMDRIRWLYRTLNCSEVLKYTFNSSGWFKVLPAPSPSLLNFKKFRLIQRLLSASHASVTQS